MYAIEVDDLHKSYGPVRAVDGISFRVRPGEVFGLLGPNGAGKTTTVEILEGYLEADRGSVRVLDHDPSTAGPEYRDRIGVMLQSSGIEDVLTVREVLDHYGRSYSNRRHPDDVIALVGLDEKADARVKTLSGGQRRRLDLAVALVGRPSLIFLDEPTTGFDPAARRDAWSMIHDLRTEGATIVLTTHYLDEAQYLADRVAVISRGRFVAEGDPSTLGGRDVAAALIRFRTPEKDLEFPDLGRWDAAVENGAVTISTDQPTAVLAELTSWARDRGRELEALEVLRPSLEDTYLRLVGEEEAR